MTPSGRLELKNIVIFLQTVLSFVLSRKIITKCNKKTITKCDGYCKSRQNLLQSMTGFTSITKWEVTPSQTCVKVLF